MTDERPLDDQLLAREDGGVLWLTLNRPEAANAITPDQRDRLIDLLADASARRRRAGRRAHRHRAGTSAPAPTCAASPTGARRGRRAPPTGWSATSPA